MLSLLHKSDVFVNYFKTICNMHSSTKTLIIIQTWKQEDFDDIIPKDLLNIVIAYANDEIYMTCTGVLQSNSFGEVCINNKLFNPLFETNIFIGVDRNTRPGTDVEHNIEHDSFLNVIHEICELMENDLYEVYVNTRNFV